MGLEAERGVEGVWVRLLVVVVAVVVAVVVVVFAMLSGAFLSLGDVVLGGDDGGVSIIMELLSILLSLVLLPLVSSPATMFVAIFPEDVMTARV